MIITLKNISKSYEKSIVIENLNLTIQDKTFTTLLGPSGCGKTTILRMIAGLETPSDGEIWFDDVCVFSKSRHINVRPEKRNLGFVFQDFALWPHLTVFENVAFGLKARKDKKNLKNRVYEALQSVQLLPYKERYPSQLSGGQQQRVGFARAIVTRPDCILFDEPLSALDAILRDEMRLEMKRLTNELKATAVFVTHDQMEAMSMSDSIVVLQKGKIEQQGEPEEIYYQPQTPFVAKFIGKSNWLSANAMFRPEKACMEEREGYAVYPAVVNEIQFTGENYQLHLDVEERKWVMDSFRRYVPGENVSVYINKDSIITF